MFFFTRFLYFGVQEYGKKAQGIVLTPHTKWIIIFLFSELLRSIPVDYHLSRKTQCYLPTGVLANLSTERLCRPCLLTVVRRSSSRGFCTQKDESHCKCTSFCDKLLLFLHILSSFFLIALQKYFHFILLNSFLFAVFNLTNVLLKLHAIKKNQDYCLIAHPPIKTASFP